MGNNNLLFIIGPQCTATSTLVGMLNCHPDIFILYETYLTVGRPTKYAKKFLKSYPEARHLFRYGQDLFSAYNRLRDFLKIKGFNYSLVGDKFADLDVDALKSLADHQVIITVRDIRTWLAKNSVINFYDLQFDVVPTAIDYVIFFLESFKLKNKYQIRMIDLIFKNKQIINELGSFLKMELNPHLNNWWVKVENFKPDEPKGCSGWWLRHHSATTKPAFKDTEVDLKVHDFWDKILPVFDKYYQGTNHNFDYNEIDMDIKSLKQLLKYSPLSLNDLYESRNSITIQKPEKRSKELIRKVVQFFYNKIMKLLNER